MRLNKIEGDTMFDCPSCGFRMRVTLKTVNPGDIERSGGIESKATLSSEGLRCLKCGKGLQVVPGDIE